MPQPPGAEPEAQVRDQMVSKLGILQCVFIPLDRDQEDDGLQLRGQLKVASSRTQGSWFRDRGVQGPDIGN